MEIKIEGKWIEGRCIGKLFLNEEDFKKIVQSLLVRDKHLYLLKKHKNVINLALGPVIVKKSDVMGKIKKHNDLLLIEIRLWHKIRWLLRDEKLDRMEVATIGRWLKLTEGLVTGIAFLAVLVVVGLLISLLLLAYPILMLVLAAFFFVLALGSHP
ncbi:MAG: hypothetical protein P1P85_05705 [Patescibacteria group bacterium]|nr:hypothetical protein [Patescibacteria group bacterium]